MAGNSFSSLSNSYSSLEASNLYFSFDFEGANIETLSYVEPTSPSFSVEGSIQFRNPSGISLSNICWSLLLAGAGVLLIWNLQMPDKIDTLVSKPKIQYLIPLVPIEEKQETRQHEIQPEIEFEQVLKEEQPISNLEPEPVSKSPKAAETDKEKVEKTKPLAQKKSQIPEQEMQPKQKKYAFYSENLNKAVKLAAKNDKYIFMKFGADWCIPCKMMEESVFKDQVIIDQLNEDFVVLDIDVSVLENLKVKDEYFVSKLPTIIVLDQYSNQVKREEGGMGITKVRTMLDEAQEDKQREETILTQVENIPHGMLK